MAIAYDFPFNPWESEINASTNADDIKKAHKIDNINHHLTVINKNLYAIYSKEMCVWLKEVQMKAEKM